MAEAKLELPLSSSGVFKEFETRRQKKIGLNLNPQQENVCVQNRKLA